MMEKKYPIKSMVYLGQLPFDFPPFFRVWTQKEKYL